MPYVFIVCCGMYCHFTFQSFSQNPLGNINSTVAELILVFFVFMFQACVFQYEWLKEFSDWLIFPNRIITIRSFKKFWKIIFFIWTIKSKILYHHARLGLKENIGKCTNILKKKTSKRCESKLNIDDIFNIHTASKTLQCCSGLCTGLECGRTWVRSLTDSTKYYKIDIFCFSSKHFNKPETHELFVPELCRNKYWMFH